MKILIKKLSIVTATLSVAMVFFGCYSNQSSNQKYSNSFRNDLPKGYVFGKVEAYQGDTKAERNCVSQMNTYNSALLMGDIDNAKLFLYPDAISYYKKFYPSDFSSDDIIEDLFREISNNVIEFKKLWEKYGIEIDFEVCDIHKKIDIGNTKIFVFPLTTTLYKEDADGEKYIHSTSEVDEFTVGISFNDGKNWYFLALIDETPNILRMRFSQSVINEVMGY